MMTAYNELYLDDAMENLGDMIDYAVYDLKFDVDEFFYFFIASGLAYQFEKGNPKYIAGMSGYELADKVIETVNVKPKNADKINISDEVRVDRSKEYWAGWVLAYYQWKTNKKFEDIIKDGLTLSTIISMYILHEADVSKFVESANEIISRNKAVRKTKLKEIREARGFTQKQLSDVSGIKLRTIQLYEQRENDINKAGVNIVSSLAQALGCDIEDLLE